ncbi:MAG: CCA tRNA nucleotidyltransferase [Syntrophothermaceae bacterium]|jgi:tRNA nucleotidyltransferase (CCA-adding enzyme)
MIVQVPETIQRMMDYFTAGQRECYLVGGAVRDLLMGRNPRDYDLAVSASTEDVIRLAAETGKNIAYVLPHGVVGIHDEDYNIEISPFKGTSIEEDLGLRDYTINAMAVSRTGRLIDPWGGQADLASELICALGKPEAMLLADPLRAFRAGRFAAMLGFGMEEHTAVALTSVLVRERLQGVAVERVREELEHTLVGAYAARGLQVLVDSGLLECKCSARTAGKTVTVAILPEVAHLQGVQQNPEYHQEDVLGHTLTTVDSIKPEIHLRWAALLHDVAKGTPGVREIRKGKITDYKHEVVGAEMAHRILTRLRVTSQVIDRVVWLVRQHMVLPRGLKWAYKHARDFPDRQSFNRAVSDLFELVRADREPRHLEVDQGCAEKFLSDTAGVPLYLSELAIDARAVVHRFGEGPQVGKIMHDLLNEVRSGSCPNNRDSLLKALERKAARKGRHKRGR